MAADSGGVPPAGRPDDRSFFGHPRGLATLFLTEMWERFSFYGMQSILVLFLVAPEARGGFGMRATTAAAVYAIYNSVAYMLAMPGGWIADRIWGARRTVLVGGVVIAVGHYVLGMLGIASSPAVVYAGLALVALGTGLLKPNMSTMVGDLYGADDPRRDAGFSLFYSGINVGAFLAPLVCGWLADHLGWHWGFAAAGVGMTIGLAQFLHGRRHIAGLGEQAQQPASPAEVARATRRAALWLAVGVAALLLDMALGTLTVHHVVDALTALAVAVAVGYFAVMFRRKDLTGAERNRLQAFVWIFLGAALFWMIADQAGSLLNLFAQEKTHRGVLGWQIPASWFQSINPAFLMALAPVFAWLWVRMGTRQPGTPTKFSLALLAIGLSFALMATAGAQAAGGRLVSPMWLVAVYLVQVVAELLLSPVGLSVSTKLAPPRLSSQVMGLWFLAAAVGDALESQVVALKDALSDGVYYGLLGAAAALAGVAFVMFRRSIQALMSGVH